MFSVVLIILPGKYLNPYHPSIPATPSPSDPVGLLHSLYAFVTQQTSRLPKSDFLCWWFMD
jgi:hypothetical protein